MEVWDLCDPQGRRLGQTHPRGQALPPGTRHAIIVVWTLNASRTKLLTTLRAPDKHPYPNTWESTGGAVQARESPVQGAAREVREETSLPCQAADLIPLGRLATPTAWTYVFVYPYQGPEDAVRPQAGETADYAWHTPVDLEALMAADRFMPPEVGQYQAFREAILSFLQAPPQT